MIEIVKDMIGAFCDILHVQTGVIVVFSCIFCLSVEIIIRYCEKKGEMVK